MAHTQQQQIRVLVIEDDQICQYLVGRYLNNYNCKIDFAATADEAKKLLKNAYDIIFLDIGLPDQDGMLLAQEIRTKLQVSTPIIAVTGHVMDKNAVQYRSAGINAVLEKPASNEDFHRMINMYVSIINDNKYD